MLASMASKPPPTGRMFKLPADVIRSLVAHTNRTASPASPLHPLLAAAAPKPLDGYLNQLEKRGLWDGQKIHRGLDVALRILLAPRRFFRMTVTVPDDSQVLHYYSGKSPHVVAFHVGKKDVCELTAPISLDAMIARFMDTVGTRADGPELPSLQTHSGLLQIVHSLVEADMTVDGAPVRRPAALVAVAQSLGEGRGADEVLDAMIDDRLVSKSDEGLRFTPEFAGWVAAIASGHRISLTRTTLTEPPQVFDVLFFGDKGARRLVWPADSGVVLCAPQKAVLRRMVGYMLGEHGQKREMLQGARRLRC